MNQTLERKLAAIMFTDIAENILKSLKVSTKLDIAKASTSNTEAYEYYLKGKYKYEKRENMEDMDIARGLLTKAIELDENLLIAKNYLGWTYYRTGDYDKAMEIFTPTLKQAEELGDKRRMGICLNNIGNVYRIKSDYEKALEYFARSLMITEESGDKYGIGYSLGSIGIVYAEKGDYDTALDYYERSLEIRAELGDKSGMGYSLNNIGLLHRDKGGLDTALDYCGRSLAIREEIGDKQGIGLCLFGIGNIYAEKGDYDTALDYFERSLAIQKEIGTKAFELLTTTYLYLTYNHLGKRYNEKTIHTLIKESGEKIGPITNYRLFELLEDTSYLETAYNQVQEKADAMDEELGKKYLSYPIPKAIVEEWEKVK